MNADFLASLLEPYDPRVPLDRLVVEINGLYHASEARDYDRRHPEIHGQLPSWWREMIALALSAGGPRRWRILNFGCGSGFEAGRLLEHVPAERIDRLTCCDPSPEMLERCRARIAPLYPDAEFISAWEAARAGGETWNLLATNSLLHHLPDPIETVKRLGSQLEPGAQWLAGHEPSRRFFANPVCARACARFQREWRWRRLLSAARWRQALRQAAGLAADPERDAATAALRRGLLGRRPPRHVIRRLVDLHVANSAEEARSGRGFDWDQMRQALTGLWSLQWVRSYSFMGPRYEGSLPRRWRRVADELRVRFPDDGASFCALWKRC